jgi:hypothetical protein
MRLNFKVDSRIFETKMKRLGTRLGPYVSATARRMIEKAYKIVQEKTPKPRKGRTDIRSLWRIKHSKRAAVEEFIIHNLYPNEDVLVYIEEGTRPHIILPKRPGGSLHFFLDSGEEIWASWVLHPGTPDHRMVATAEMELEKMTDFYVKETFKQIDKLTKAGLR